MGTNQGSFKTENKAVALGKEHELTPTPTLGSSPYFGRLLN